MLGRGRIIEIELSIFLHQRVVNIFLAIARKQRINILVSPGCAVKSNMEFLLEGCVKKNNRSDIQILIIQATAHQQSSIILFSNSLRENSV